MQNRQTSRSLFGMSYGGPTPPPYGYGPSTGFGQPMGYTPPPQQSFFARHPMLAIRLGIVAIVVPVAIGIGIFAVWQSGKNKVLCDAGSVGGHVFVDGKDKGEIAANGHKTIDLDKGSHVIEAKDASGKTLEKATVEIPNGSFRGAFRFGKARPLVRVSEIYGHAPDAIVKATPIMETYSDDAFTAFPNGTDLDSLDTPFVDTIQMGQSEQYRIVWKVCHFNKGKRGPAQVACAGAPISANDGH